MALLLSSVIVAAGCKPHHDAKAGEESPDQSPRRITKAAAQAQPDLSGHTRFGDASFYAKEFAGREMADGSKMDPLGDNAASKTLPLGTRATVTNITTGQSAVVTIQDRGPYVKGRIVDLAVHSTENWDYARRRYRQSQSYPDLSSSAEPQRQSRHRGAEVSRLAASQQ